MDIQAQFLMNHNRAYLKNRNIEQKLKGGVISLTFEYWLPNKLGQKEKHKTQTNSVVIIGANGSGKSKLGAWIEQQDLSNIHRIGGQRNLNFSENIPLKRYSQAEDYVWYGSTDSNGPYKQQKGQRWGWGDDKRLTTQLLNDFDDVLAALFALKNNENDLFVQQCREADIENRERPSVPTTVIDKLKLIWKSVLQERSIIDEDSKIYAIMDKNCVKKKYSATQMSDGERAVLYLSAQVLCVPFNKTIIIDEPELHLHRSIMNRLWKALENSRPDCLFIYITHDTQFAAEHNHTDTIWVKEFDGQNWKLEKLNDNALPKELVLDILGSRKNALFVEGERNSYDTQLYSELYPDYYIIPCGSCSQVIARTKAFHNNPSLHDYEAYGIIDRDFRSEHEINKYQNDNIYTIEVAEVENLFIVEELVRLMAVHMGKDQDGVFEAVKKHIIHDRFAKQINGQICEGTVADIKYRLSCAEISKKSDTEAKASLYAALAKIDYDSIKKEQEHKFQTVLQSDLYAEVIKVFNKKSIVNSVGHFMGINDKEYCPTIIALLHGSKHDEILNALDSYLPIGIPR